MISALLAVVITLPLVSFAFMGAVALSRRPPPPTRHTHEARATRSSAAVATGTDGEAGAADGVRPPSVRPARGSRGPAALRVRAESGLGQGLRGVQQRHAANLVVAHAERLCGAISTGVARHPHDWRLRGRLALPGRLLRPEVRLGLARTRGIWRWVLGLVATSERASTFLTLSLGLGRQLLRTTSLC
jgi:hypothetical protein